MKNPLVDACGITLMGGLSIIGAVLLAFLAACMSVAYWSESSKCDSIKQLTGDSTYVSLNTGCLVNHNGRWLSGDTVLTNQIEITR